MEAVQLEGEALEAFWAGLATEDPALKHALEGLLAADRRNQDGFLDVAEEPADDPIVAPELPPTALGPFRIESVLGEGEYAVVYLARREGAEDRGVALKVLRRQGVPQDVMSRFDQERRIIALMSHPNVAQMYGTGVLPDGRAYIEMEYVAGEPITAFAKKAGLARRQCLALFMQACQGVEHAHHRGIIHRDLKPTNILAARDGEGGTAVKVIDFGIAKVTVGGAAPAVTRQGQVIGTPAYMSPEQLTGGLARSDTRSDVYSLGAVLYELLTGARIVESDEAGPITIITQVMLREPRRAEAIDPSLRGDLAAIIRKSLAKDPAGRYQSVADLRADLSRYLEGRPVVAQLPSAGYIARKFVARNRALVGVVCAGLLALGAAGWRAWTAQQERFDLAVAVTRSWLDQTVEMARTAGQRGRRGPMLERLEAQSADLYAHAPTHPGVRKLRASILGAAGDFEQENGRNEHAGEFFREALAIREGLASQNVSDTELSLDLSVATVRMGDYELEAGRKQEALVRYQSALALDEAALTRHPDSARALSQMAWSCNRMASLFGQLDGDPVIRHGFYERGLRVSERLCAVRSSADSYRTLSTAHIHMAHFLTQNPEWMNTQAHAEHIRLALDHALAAVRAAPSNRLALCHAVDMRVQYLNVFSANADPHKLSRTARATARIGRALFRQDPGDPVARSAFTGALSHAVRFTEAAGESDVLRALSEELEELRRGGSPGVSSGEDTGPLSDCAKALNAPIDLIPSDAAP